MKKLFITLITACLLLSLTACGKKPESAVKGALDSIKSGNLKKLPEYVVDASDFEGPDYDQFKELFNDIFKSMSYTIDKTETTDDKNAVVTTTITAPNVGEATKNAFVDFISWAIQQAVSEKELDEDEAGQKLIELVRENMTKLEGKTTTTTVDIEVIKDDKGNWKAKSDTDVVDAIMGGFLKAISDLGY